MTTLVTGGTGYIGSHVVRLLVERGGDTVVVDDVVTGDARRIGDVPLVRADLGNSESVETLVDVIKRYNVDEVVHFAARKQVAESVERPSWYYSQNVGSLANVLLAVEKCNISRVVFSSSAAVYGNAGSESLTERSPTEPINPYGMTKLIGERMLADAAAAHGLGAVSLRYFNVAGAGWPDLGDRAILNLVPMVFERLDADEPPLIFGDDYDTPDGTCVRDFVHVRDLADAHVAVLDALQKGTVRSPVFNVGTGGGTSVRQIIETALRVSGSQQSAVVRGRRPGDPSSVIADTRLIENELGWTHKLGIEAIVASAWQSWVANR